MAGRKNFVAGEILTAADVNSFLMDQSVMVFDDSAARGAAIPTPSEGMVTYRKDDNAVEVFDGSAFGPIGKILQVVSTTKTNTFSSTTGSNNYVSVTGLSAVITPSSTNSKVWILATVVGSGGVSSNTGFSAKLSGGNTASYRGGAAGSRSRGVSNANAFVTGAQNSADTITMNYLDAPNTTSAVTYEVQVTAIGAGDTVFVNRSQVDTDAVNRLRGASTITVLEVAG